MELKQYLEKKWGASANLARSIGVTRQCIYKWRKGTKIPAHRILQIWFATNGEVSLHDMRPDLYPPDM